jgi:hypothetical protein
VELTLAIGRDGHAQTRVMANPLAITLRTQAVVVHAFAASVPPRWRDHLKKAVFGECGWTKEG